MKFRHHINSQNNSLSGEFGIKACSVIRLCHVAYREDLTDVGITCLTVRVNSCNP